MNDPSRKIVCLQAHLSGSVIYVYDSMGIRGLGRAIFKFISTITFKGIPHKIILKSVLAVNRYYLLRTLTFKPF